MSNAPAPFAANVSSSWVAPDGVSLVVMIDPSQRLEMESLLLKLGTPLLLFSMLEFVVVWLTKTEFAASWATWLQGSTPLSQGTSPYKTWRLVGLGVFALVEMIPFALLWSLGLSLVAKVDPNSVGLVLVATLLGLVLVARGVFQFWENHWHMNRMTMGFLSLAHVCLSAAIILVVYFGKAERFSFTSCAIAMLSLQFQPMLYLIFLNQPHGDVASLLDAIRGANKLQWDEDLGKHVKQELSAAELRHEATKAGHHAIYQAIAVLLSLALLGCMGATLQTKRVSNGVTIDPDEPATENTVGWIIAANVLFADIFTWMLRKASITGRVDAMREAFECLACRLLLVGFGTQNWMIGSSGLFLVLAYSVGTSVVDLLLPDEGEDEVLKTFQSAKGVKKVAKSSRTLVKDKKELAESGGREDEVEMFKFEATAGESDVQNFLCFSFSSAGSRLLVASLLLLALVVPFIVMIVLAAQGKIYNAEFKLWDTEQPQWLFGVAALCISSLVLLAKSFFRALKGGSGAEAAGDGGVSSLIVADEGKTLAAVLGVLAWVVPAVLGGIIAAETDSKFVKWLTIFAPPVVIFGTISWQLYGNMGYQFLNRTNLAVVGVAGTGFEATDATAPAKASGSGSVSAGSPEPGAAAAPAPGMCSTLSARDKLFMACMIITVSSGVSCGVIITVNVDPQVVGMTVLFAFLNTLLTGLGLVRLFHRGMDQVVATLLGLGGLTAAAFAGSVVAFGAYEATNKSAVFMVPLMLYAIVVSFYIAWSSLEIESEDLKFEPLGVWGLVVGCGCLLILAVLNLAVYSTANSKVFGGSLLAALVLLLMAVFSIYVWASESHGSKYRMPRWYSYMVGAIMFLALVGGIFLAVKKDDVIDGEGSGEQKNHAADSAFLTASVPMLLGAVSLMIYGALKLWPTRKKTTIFSKQIFPIFRYNVVSATLDEQNSGGLAILLSAVLIYIWGMAAAMNVHPTAIGIALSGFSLDLFVLWIVSSSFSKGAQIQQLLPYIDRSSVSRMILAAFIKTYGISGDTKKKEAKVVRGQDLEMPVPRSKKLGVGVAAARKKLANATTCADAVKLAAKVKEVSVAEDRAWNSERVFEAYLTISLIQNGRFSRKQIERQLLEQVRKMGCSSAKASDIRAWDESFIAQMRTLLESDDKKKVEEEAWLAKQDQIARDGKRSKACFRLEDGATIVHAYPAGDVPLQVDSGSASAPRSRTISSIMRWDDEAEAKALQKVSEELAKFEELGGSMRYLDHDFPPWTITDVEPAPHVWVGADNAAHTGDEAKMWAKQPTIFHDNIESADINQGVLGDCWFLAAMAAVADRAEGAGIKACFVGTPDDWKKMEKCGCYAVKLFWQREAVVLFLDDLLPTYGNDDYVQDFQPILCKSKDPGADAVNPELWPCLIEKAFAKLFGPRRTLANGEVVGGYEEIASGIFTNGVVALTGGSGGSCAHMGTPTPEHIVTGKLWSDIMRWNKMDYFLGASSCSGSDAHKNKNNIVLGHAFTVLSAVEVEGFKLLKVRNPWGETEWNGPWSDESPLWAQHPKAKVACNLVVEDDGCFWIEWDDYIRNFSRTSYVLPVSSPAWEMVSLTIEKPPEDYEGGYKTKNASTIWMDVARSVDMVMSLTVAQDTGDGKEKAGMMLLQAGECRITGPYSYQWGMEVARTDSKDAGKTAAKVAYLEAADECYNLIIATESGDSGDWIYPCTIEVKAPKGAVTLREAPADCEAKDGSKTRPWGYPAWSTA